MRAIGILILTGWLTYGPGGLITEAVLDAPDALASVAANQTTFALGAVLMLLNSAAVVGIGVLWYPILKPHSQRVALSYFGVRVLEAMLCALGVIGLLSLIGVSDSYVSAGAVAGGHFETLGVLAVEINDLSYHVGMAALGAGSLAFCSLLYRTRLVPQPLAAWGVLGYAVFLTGMVLELVGVGVGVLLSLPGGLFELVFAAWLITKGIDEPPHLTCRP